VVASQVHLVRHGEVFNPDGILYGRLPGFGLSKLGHRMAQAAADEIISRGRTVASVRVSPLQRTRESAAPVLAAVGLEPVIDDRIIEPTNHFEGTVMRRALKKPQNWPFLINPVRPSWGEAYTSIEKRMRAAIDDAFESVNEGDVILVSHQLPIWISHLSVAGERFWHDPRSRRCALSSITTFERTTEPAETPAGGAAAAGPAADSADATAPVLRLIEVGYVEPAADLQASATDVGAV
jgi:broad specificity phosphatase PhoE